ncbi:MAG: putative outer membrane protein [Solirubrobacterales bacterium]|nr:putative outer membrane protein [Solirubrobacterales bacterium]
MKKLFVVLAFAVLALPASASGQATRTWVSGVGDDANPCSRTAPCKTWAGAISRTLPQGEINALDPGGFGAVTITKEITIDGGASLAGVLTSGGSGVLISIPPTVATPVPRVVLRNLEIDGVGTAQSGVRVLQAGSVVIERSRIFGFVRGIDFAPGGTTDASLLADEVSLKDNRQYGLLARAANPTQKLDVMLRNSTISGTTAVGGTPGDVGIGVAADTGAHVWITGSSIFDNVIGVKALNTTPGNAGIIDSFCDNQVAGNGTDGTFTSTICQNPPPPTVVTNTVTTTAPAPPPVTVTNTVTVPAKTVPVPAKCVVPQLSGLTLAAARTKLTAAKCALGTVTRKKTTNPKRVGRVTAQKTAAKKSLTAGTKIAVTIGKK